MFRRHGLHRERIGPQDRRRFEVELPNDLWQADCMHGPRVISGGKLRKTFLFACIDDHSRLVHEWNTSSFVAFASHQYECSSGIQMEVGDAQVDKLLNPGSSVV